MKATRRHFACTVTTAQANQRLDLFVGQWLAREFGRPLSKSFVRKVVMAGAVRINSRPVRRPGLLVEPGSNLAADIDVGEVERAGAKRDSVARSESSGTRAGHTAQSTDELLGPSEVPALAILYEDDDLIAVAKPAGMVIHATADPARRDVFNTVRRLLASRRSFSSAGTLEAGERRRPDRCGGAADCADRQAGGASLNFRTAQALARPATREPLPYLGLHHRLDVDTSGVVLFTKQERANANLAEQFARGEVTKVYHALAKRPGSGVRREWRVENHLAPSGSGRRSRMVAVASGGVRAVTDFRVVEDRQKGLPTHAQVVLVEARPHTGRKHQIRSHLAESGMPILGDVRYGGPLRVGRCQAARVMLHASRLSFRHPVSGIPVTIDCPYPADFAQMLSCLLK